MALFDKNLNRLICLCNLDSDWLDGSFRGINAIYLSSFLPPNIKAWLCARETLSWIWVVSFLLPKATYVRITSETIYMYSTVAIWAFSYFTIPTFLFVKKNQLPQSTNRGQLGSNQLDREMLRIWLRLFINHNPSITQLSALIIKMK